MSTKQLGRAVVGGGRGCGTIIEFSVMVDHGKKRIHFGFGWVRCCSVLLAVKGKP